VRKNNGSERAKDTHFVFGGEGASFPQKVPNLCLMKDKTEVCEEVSVVRSRSLKQR
jgi:hypothetical protein